MVSLVEQLLFAAFTCIRLKGMRKVNAFLVGSFHCNVSFL